MFFYGVERDEGGALHGHVNIFVDGKFHGHLARGRRAQTLSLCPGKAHIRLVGGVNSGLSKEGVVGVVSAEPGESYYIEVSASREGALSLRSMSDLDEAQSILAGMPRHDQALSRARSGPCPVVPG